MKSLNGSFWHWQVSWLAVSIVVACFSSPSIHSVYFISFQPLRSQDSLSKQAGFWIYFYPKSILHSNLYPPFHPHNPSNLSTPDTTSLVQLARFSISSGGDFYKHLLVLSNTVKWSTFCTFSSLYLQFFAGYSGLKSLKLRGIAKGGYALA